MNDVSTLITTNTTQVFADQLFHDTRISKVNQEIRVLARDNIWRVAGTTLDNVLADTQGLRT